MLSHFSFHLSLHKPKFRNVSYIFYSISIWSIGTEEIRKAKGEKIRGNSGAWKHFCEAHFEKGRCVKARASRQGYHMSCLQVCISFSRNGKPLKGVKWEKWHDDICILKSWLRTFCVSPGMETRSHCFVIATSEKTWTNWNINSS